MKQKKGKKKRSSHLLIGYSLVIVGVFALFFVGLISFNWAKNTNVLGVSTFLAYEGESGGDTSESGSSNSGLDQTHDENTKTAPVSNDGQKETVSGSTLVSCTGPDGKTFQTSAVKCKRLNESWHRPVRFTKDGGTPRPPRPTGALENEKKPIIIKFRKPEQRVGEKDGLQVQQHGEDNFILKQGSTEAQTKFRLMINKDTHQITVTTPTGDKSVSVMPDDAVKDLVAKKVITKLQNNASSSVSLEEKKNNPVFVISGESNQHLFGFIPVKIKKSVDVSAQTGQVISQNESFGQRLLDIFSF